MQNQIVINLSLLRDDINNFVDFDLLFTNCNKHKKFSLNQIEYLDLLQRMQELKEAAKW